jgi:hypothetical protein
MDGSNMEIDKIFSESNLAKELFDGLVIYDASVPGIHIWHGEENGRYNKKFLFSQIDDWMSVVPCKFHQMVEHIIKKVNQYESPFGKQKIGALERIQVINSKFTSEKNHKGIHLFNFHIDRINTYKGILYCSNVTCKDGPFAVMELNGREGEIAEKLDFLEKCHAAGKDWRKIDTTFEAVHYNNVEGVAGDIVIVDGREPHRAGTVENRGCRKAIIFEFFTLENSTIYRNSTL